MPSPASTDRITRGRRAVASVYLLSILVMVLTPSARLVTTIKFHVGRWIQGGHRFQRLPSLPVGDVFLNVVAFIPLTWLLNLGWPRARAWAWGLFGCLVSAIAETGQLVLPEIHRRPDIMNVLENSLGAWIGVWAYLVLTPRLHRWHRWRRTSPLTRR